MKNEVIKARAKINLTLEIFDKRKDGYHEMRSVMHKIGLCDLVSLSLNEEAAENEFHVACDKDLCPEKENLAYRAAAAFAEKYTALCSRHFSLQIDIEKHIPAMAGLGGGSADAAAVLDGLFRMLGVLSDAQVEEIAASLGADVPFMREKYDAALATGIGTKLQKVPMMPLCYAVIGTPKVGLSTREIYDLFDEKKQAIPAAHTNALIAGLEQEDFSRICDCMSNQFEPICIHKLPEIGKIKKSLLKSGAYAAQMSGSGSAVFGIFDTEKAAKEAYEALGLLPFETERNLCRI